MMQFLKWCTHTNFEKSVHLNRIRFMQYAYHESKCKNKKENVPIIVYLRGDLKSAAKFVIVMGN